MNQTKNPELKQAKNVYGWHRDTSREGDEFHLFAIHPNLAQITQVDLRKLCPPVYDQGQLGSCTANAIAGAYQFDEMKQNESGVFMPSRLFIYYNERVIEHDVSEDSGGQLKDGIGSIANTGVCPESEWPYNISKFAVKPPQACYTTANNHKSISYKRVTQNLNQMKQCLIEGFPFVFGFTVFESFESEQVAETGIVPMPNVETEQCLGGHAVVCVGYDDTKQSFIIRNSWGNSWGLAGYFYMPYAYLENDQLASDLWTVRQVADKN